MEQVAIHALDTVDGGLGRELIERAPSGRGTVGAHELLVGGECDDRAREQLDVLRRHDDSRLAVGDDLGQAPHTGDDRRAAPLRRLERDHAEALAARRNDDDRVPLVDLRRR